MKELKPIVTLVGATGWDSVSTTGTIIPLKIIASQLLNMQGKMNHNINGVPNKVKKGNGENYE